MRSVLLLFAIDSQGDLPFEAVVLGTDSASFSIARREIGP